MALFNKQHRIDRKTNSLYEGAPRPIS